jgi:hypothetical protein
LQKPSGIALPPSVQARGDNHFFPSLGKLGTRTA